MAYDLKPLPFQMDKSKHLTPDTHVPIWDHNEESTWVQIKLPEWQALVAALRRTEQAIAALEGTPIEYGYGMELAAALKQARAALAIAAKENNG